MFLRNTHYYDFYHEIWYILYIAFLYFLYRLYTVNRPISAVPQNLHWTRVNHCIVTRVNHCIVDSEVEHVCPHPTWLSPGKPLKIALEAIYTSRIPFWTLLLAQIIFLDLSKNCYGFLLLFDIFIISFGLENVYAFFCEINRLCQLLKFWTDFDEIFRNYSHKFWEI